MATTICLTLDFDAVCSWMQWGSTDARALSRGEFGAKTAAPRLLDLCASYELESTWFVPGHTADTYPQVCAAVAEAGHEIANHGYVHETFSALSPEEARAVLRRGNESLERATGQRPRGFRLPQGGASPGLFRLLVEEGFSYDSSLQGEYQPYWCRDDDVVRMDGPNVEGPRVDLVELPATFITSDFAYFEFSFAAPELRAGLRNPREVEQIWRDQLDYLVERVGHGFLMLMLHPQSIGWASRILMLERFVEYCLERGARFATCERVADEFRAAQ